MATNTTSTKKNKGITKIVKDVEDTKDVVTKSVSAKDIVEMAKSEQIKEDEEETREVIKNVPKAEAKPVKVYDQHDLILCRSLYVWHNTGDLCEVEYGDLWAAKASRSQYLYSPHFIIEDEELLEQPRWKDLKTFYDEKIYGLDNVDAILNVPTNQIRRVLEKLADGMKRAVAVRATILAESGELDSIKKIKIIDEVCGTDILSILPD